MPVSRIQLENANGQWVGECEVGGISALRKRVVAATLAEAMVQVMAVFEDPARAKAELSTEREPNLPAAELAAWRREKAGLPPLEDKRPVVDEVREAVDNGPDQRILTAEEVEAQNAKAIAAVEAAKARAGQAPSSGQRELPKAVTAKLTSTTRKDRAQAAASEKIVRAPRQQRTFAAPPGDHAAAGKDKLPPAA